ncbi:MAG TPA: hypothetical protein VF060_05975 [Trebonia sp.]
MQVTDVSLIPGTRKPAPASERWRARLAGLWATPAGKIMALATLLALIVRILTLLHSGYLRGITEYDDGVYLGAAIRLTQGVMPYKDFAFVQPPGILLLMSPVAAVAQVFTTVKALALARVLTALASVACVPLAGNLIRYRGSVVTLVTCGLLAVYPSDIATAHTLLLEPWMNLFCLIAANAAFRRGALTSPRRLLWAGLAFGFAASIKFWAAAPAAVVLALCLLTRDRRVPRLRRYVPGLAVGFLLPVLPFLVSAPVTFWHSTVTDQATRAGSAVPLPVRFAYLTGTIDILNSNGQVSFDAGWHAMYAAGASPHVDLSAGVGWLPYAAAAVIVALVAAGYGLQRRRLTHLEWLALVTAALAAVAILGYSAFFYHYPDFPAPWLAITLGSAAGALAAPPRPADPDRASPANRPRPTSRPPLRVRIRPSLIGTLAALIIVVTALQFRETSTSREPEAENLAHLIPVGACVVTDEVSLPIAADRFTAKQPGCPVIVDSLAETLVRSNGVSVQGGASQIPSVVAQWRTWLGEADYVWLSPSHNSRRRIPWTPALSAWFNASFKPISPYSPGTGQIFKRITPSG